jgi:hypothetical protein
VANLKDYATGTVLTAPSPATSGTSLALQTGEGALMPATPFYATVAPDNTLPTLPNAEKVQVTNVTGDTLTIVRARGDTTAKSIATGWRLSNALFAADIDEKAPLVSPSFTTPTLGVATATSINKLAITAPATASTLTIDNGKTFRCTSSLTLSGTDGTTMTFPSTSDTVAGLAAVQTITGAWSYNDGKLILKGATSGTSTLKAAAVAGTTTITLPSITDTLAGLASVQTITGAWSFNDGKLVLNGVTSGNTTLKSGAIAGTSVITLPTGTDTLVGKATTDTLTNKTLTGGLATADPSAALGLATKQYVDALGTTSLVQGEVPTGTINGSNVTFTTASQFATGSLRIYKNGVRLKITDDYTVSGNTITFVTAPATGTKLLVDYNVTNSVFVQGSNSIIVQETPTGTVNGSNTTFTTLQGKYVANSLEVFVNGLQQTKTTDYAETTPGSGVFTFTVAPLTGDIVKVSYQFSTGASGNADTIDGIHASATPTANQLVALDSNAKMSILTLTNPYKFSGYRNAALTATSSAETKLVFDAEEYDINSNFDTSNGRYTVPAIVPTSSTYHFDARFSVATSSVVSFIILYKNGVAFKRGSLGKANAEYQGSVLSADVQVSPGDYFEIFYYVGGALAFETGALHCYFQGRLVP